MSRIFIFITLFLIPIIFSCDKPKKTVMNCLSTDFDTSTLQINSENYKNVRGQLIYLPVYSNIPYLVDTTEYEFDMSAFVAIHNTDLKNSIKITKVLYFNTNGKIVCDFLNDETKILEPLSTVDYFIPYEDKSGIGSNFLIEWISENPVNEPLIEAITINLKTYHSAAIVSNGKIIREIK